MIAEQTALQTRTHSTLTPATVAGVSEGVEFTATQSTGWRSQLQAFARQALTVTISLLGALASAGSPAFFDVERQGPVQRRAGSRTESRVRPLLATLGMVGPNVHRQV